MQLTPTITFRGLTRTPAIEADIAAKVDTLETYCQRIIGCHVLVELVQRHAHGNRYHVRVDVIVPGDEIVVAHEAGLHRSNICVEGDRKRGRGDSRFLQKTHDEPAGRARPPHGAACGSRRHRPTPDDMSSSRCTRFQK